MKKKTVKPRRLLSTALGASLVIALTSCSGATNSYGDIPKETYAKSGNYKISYKELWDELKWSADEVLEDQITNVVLQKYAKRIEMVRNTDFSNLESDDIEDLGLDTKASDGGKKEYEELQDWYKTELTNYVIQDIYNLTYNAEGYDDNLKDVNATTKYLNEIKYVDEIYTTYHVDKIDGEELKDLVVGVYDRENDMVTDAAKANYLKIAESNELKSAYYKIFAQKLLAREKHTEDVYEDDDDDSDSDDTNLGHYDYSNYATKFKEDYINTNDLEAILVCFSSDEEYTSTLRAFGLKFYNGQLYYIKDNKPNMTYSEYIEYYDDFSNNQLNSQYGAISVDNTSYASILEIYVQLYNYIYAGYRQPIRTGNIDFGVDDYNYSLDTLRQLTNKILSLYSTGDDYELYTNALTNIEDALKDNTAEDDTRITYTADEIQDLGSSFMTLLYNTLDNEDLSKSYSTSTTSAGQGKYLCYKLNEIEPEDEETKKHSEWYDKVYDKEGEVSTYDIISYILDEENKYGNLDENGEYGYGSLKYKLEQELILDDLTTESNINSYVANEGNKTKVRIYNEACEISYGINHSDYSETTKKIGNKNILATIKYKGTKYKLYIYADEDTSSKKAVCKIGTDEAIGVFNTLEQKKGTSTAISLLSNKMIKDTKAYKDTKKYRNDYETYIDNILLNFANDAYSSNGFDSSIGKYKFLMSYYHTANIDKIVNNYYRLQAASTKLLADYSNDELVEFIKNYTDTAYEKYFSLSTTRFYVYFDGDDDGDADNVTDWKDKIVEDWEKIDGSVDDVTMEYVTKQLIYDVYNIISASTTAHTDKISELVEEINNSARVKFENNPIKSEALWAKYRHLGLKVATEDVTATNSSTDVSYTIKQRLYDYANGFGEVLVNGVTEERYYQYFLEDANSVPTCYIEPIYEEAVSNDSNIIIESKDGFNLLLVTTGTVKASAEWLEKDNEEKLLENLVLIYNDDEVFIDNIYTDPDQENTDLFTLNQIKLYMLDYIINGESKLMPSDISSAVSAFLQPVVSRFTGTETQSIILLSFMKKKTGSNAAKLCDVIEFSNEEYNGTSGYFNRALEINEDVADSYNRIYGDSELEKYGVEIDTTGTYDIYSYNGKTWWEYVESIVENILLTKEGD